MSDKLRPTAQPCSVGVSALSSPHGRFGLVLCVICHLLSAQTWSSMISQFEDKTLGTRISHAEQIFLDNCCRRKFTSQIHKRDKWKFKQPLKPISPVLQSPAPRRRHPLFLRTNSEIQRPNSLFRPSPSALLKTSHMFLEMSPIPL